MGCGVSKTAGTGVVNTSPAVGSPLQAKDALSSPPKQPISKSASFKPEAAPLAASLLAASKVPSAAVVTNVPSVAPSIRQNFDASIPTPKPVTPTPIVAIEPPLLDISKNAESKVASAVPSVAVSAIPSKVPSAAVSKAPPTPAEQVGTKAEVDHLEQEVLKEVHKPLTPVPTNPATEISKESRAPSELPAATSALGEQVSRAVSELPTAALDPSKQPSRSPSDLPLPTTGELQASRVPSAVGVVAVEPSLAPSQPFDDAKLSRLASEVSGVTAGPAVAKISRVPSELQGGVAIVDGDIAKSSGALSVSAPVIAASTPEGEIVQQKDLAYQGTSSTDAFDATVSGGQSAAVEPAAEEWTILPPGEIPPEIDQSLIKKEYLVDEIEKRMAEEAALKEMEQSARDEEIRKKITAEDVEMEVDSMLDSIIMNSRKSKNESDPAAQEKAENSEQPQQIDLIKAASKSAFAASKTGSAMELKPEGALNEIIASTETATGDLAAADIASKKPSELNVFENPAAASKAVSSKNVLEGGSVVQSKKGSTMNIEPSLALQDATASIKGSSANLPVEQAVVALTAAGSKISVLEKSAAASHVDMEAQLGHSSKVASTNNLPVAAVTSVKGSSANLEGAELSAKPSVSQFAATDLAASAKPSKSNSTAEIAAGVNGSKKASAIDLGNRSIAQSTKGSQANMTVGGPGGHHESSPLANAVILASEDKISDENSLTKEHSKVEIEHTTETQETAAE
ncbi:hypothetical protein HDU84_004399 [Entophlyctis sp. JEL0112]|nr:hypothetical protein HDU84_004399 [Entophlyctis sp. JEL0112]